MDHVQKEKNVCKDARLIYHVLWSQLTDSLTK